MPKTISAFLANDGSVHVERGDAERHEIGVALKDRMDAMGTETWTIADIISNREWLEKVFSDARKTLPGGPSDIPIPASEQQFTPEVRLAS